jgi:hypothetical protein
MNDNEKKTVLPMDLPPDTDRSIDWSGYLIDNLVVLGTSIASVLAFTGGLPVTGVCLLAAGVYAAVTADGYGSIFDRTDDLLIYLGLCSFGAGWAFKSAMLAAASVGAIAVGVVGAEEVLSNVATLIIPTSLAAFALFGLVPLFAKMKEDDSYNESSTHRGRHDAKKASKQHEDLSFSS